MRGFVLLAVLAIALPLSGAPHAAAAQAPTTLQFAGHTWIVQNGSGPPGPNLWSSSNAFVDSQGALHLKITRANGSWYGAWIYTDALGFGRYQFQVLAPLGTLDRRVVFDLFNYGAADGVDEIDTEFARYGWAGTPVGHDVVYPNVAGTPPVSHDFAIPTRVTSSTHTMDWSSTRVAFRSVDDSTGATLSQWTYAPPDPLAKIPQDPLRFEINLWLWHGQPPLNRQPVEVVVRAITMP